MYPDRVALFGATVAIVALAIATGPHVGLLAIPEGGFGAGGPPGSGTADVTVVSTPDRAELVAGTYGDVHYLTVPDSTVRVANVTGAPYLTVSVDVEDVWIGRTTVHSLRPGMAGTYDVSLERASIDGLEPRNRTLEGRLWITLHDRDGTTTVSDEPIRVEVTE